MKNLFPQKLFLLMPAIIPFIAAIFYFYIFDGTAFAPILYLAAKLFILLYPILFYSKTDSIKLAFRFNAQAAAVGLSVAILIFICGLVLLQIPYLQIKISEGISGVQSKLDDFGAAEHYLLIAFVISVLHSLLEEYYWRWFLFGASKANIFSAFAFSLHHFVVLFFFFPLLTATCLTVVVFLGGVIFNLLYARYKNIWAAWFAHVGADLFIFYVGYLLIHGRLS